MIAKVLPVFLIEPSFYLIFFVVGFPLAALAKLNAGCYTATCCVAFSWQSVCSVLNFARAMTFEMTARFFFYFRSYTRSSSSDTRTLR